MFSNKNKGLGQLHPRENSSALLQIRQLDPWGKRFLHMPSSSCLSPCSPSWAGNFLNLWSGNQPIYLPSSLSPYLPPGLIPITFTYLFSQIGSTSLEGPERASTLCSSEIIITFTKDRWETDTQRRAGNYPRSPAQPGMQPLHPSPVYPPHCCWLVLSHLLYPHCGLHFWACCVSHLYIFKLVVKRWQHNPKRLWSSHSDCLAGFSSTLPCSSPRAWRKMLLYAAPKAVKRSLYPD